MKKLQMIVSIANQSIIIRIVFKKKIKHVYRTFDEFVINSSNDAKDNDEMIKKRMITLFENKYLNAKLEIFWDFDFYFLENNHVKNKAKQVNKLQLQDGMEDYYLLHQNDYLIIQISNHHYLIWHKNRIDKVALYIKQMIDKILIRPKKIIHFIIPWNKNLLVKQSELDEDNKICILYLLSNRFHLLCQKEHEFSHSITSIFREADFKAEFIRVWHGLEEDYRANYLIIYYDSSITNNQVNQFINSIKGIIDYEFKKHKLKLLNLSGRVKNIKMMNPLIKYLEHLIDG